MNLLIFSSDIEYLGDIPLDKSVIEMTWKDCSRELGTFSFIVQPTESNRQALIDMLVKENIVYIGEPRAGIIKTAIKRVTDSGVEQIEVGGKLSEEYIGRRIVWGKVNYEGKHVDTAMREMVENAVTAPSNKNRKISTVQLGTDYSITDSVDYQDSYGNLLEDLYAIGKTTDYLFNLALDPAEKMFSFNVFKGVDRTVGQSDRDPVVFTRKLNNVISLEYTDSNIDYKNTALVGGQGEDTARVTKSVNDSNVGLDRYELFVDARDLSQTDEDGTAISDSSYKKLLAQRGLEKLEETPEYKTLDGEYSVEGYMPDEITVGDKVTVMETDWGLTMDAEITIKETRWEAGSYESVTLTFGNNIPTLLDKK